MREHKTPEKNKKPGVSYVWTEDGIELPVIDITHAAFAENADADTLALLSKDFLDFQGRPAFIRRFITKRSIALRGMASASGTFLGGMTTYVAKLGPEALGKGYSGFMDRKVAANIGSVGFRLRLRDMANLMAEELAARLAARPGSPLRMINIGGGPAMDSLNTLILIRKSAPASLDGRRILIRVLDVDKDGPAFGARAAEALSGQCAPLSGLSVSFERVDYDWTRPSDLRAAIGKIEANDVAIGSSEGGLFEYGSDETIVGNLKALHDCTPSDFFVAGSIVRDGPLSQSMATSSSMAFRALTIGRFKALVTCAGWVLDRAIESSPIYAVVGLKKAGSSLP